MGSSNRPPNDVLDLLSRAERVARKYCLLAKKDAPMTTPYPPKQTTTRGHTVQINDIEMYHEEYGVGKPLVLLHGFGGCAQNWHPFTARLSERHRLIVVDLRGHGYSTNPESRFTHREAASDVFLLLDKLGVGHFSAMGISSGGMALLHMATSQPKRVDSMVLISATSYFPDQARAIMREAAFERMPQQVQKMYRACAKRGEAQIRQLSAQFNALHENYDDMKFTAHIMECSWRQPRSYL